MDWFKRIYTFSGRLAPGVPTAPGLALIMACGACTPGADGPLEPARPPAGAVQVSSELYMVPAGADDSGCPMFQPWSPTLMVVQALHWRSADGSFTLDRNAADCPPPD